MRISQAVSSTRHNAPPQGRTASSRSPVRPQINVVPRLGSKNAPERPAARTLSDGQAGRRAAHSVLFGRRTVDNVSGVKFQLKSDYSVQRKLRDKRLSSDSAHIVCTTHFKTCKRVRRAQSLDERRTMIITPVITEAVLLVSQCQFLSEHQIMRQLHTPIGWPGCTRRA